MMFRDYGEVHPLTKVSASPEGLDEAIERVGKKYDIIDLQFSSRTLLSGGAEYSALMLIGKRKGGKKKCSR
jgi:hypothetical protein